MAQIGDLIVQGSLAFLAVISRRVAVAPMIAAGGVELAATGTLVVRAVAVVTGGQIALVIVGTVLAGRDLLAGGGAGGLDGYVRDVRMRRGKQVDVCGAAHRAGADIRAAGSAKVRSPGIKVAAIRALSQMLGIGGVVNDVVLGCGFSAAAVDTLLPMILIIIAGHDVVDISDIAAVRAGIAVLGAAVLLRRRIAGISAHRAVLSVVFLAEDIVVVVMRTFGFDQATIYDKAFVVMLFCVVIPMHVVDDCHALKLVDILIAQVAEAAGTVPLMRALRAGFRGSCRTAQAKRQHHQAQKHFQGFLHVVRLLSCFSSCGRMHHFWESILLYIYIYYVKNRKLNLF